MTGEATWAVRGWKGHSTVARSDAHGERSIEVPRTLGTGGYAPVPWGPIQLSLRSGCDW